MKIFSLRKKSIYTLLSLLLALLFLVLFPDHTKQKQALLPSPTPTPRNEQVAGVSVTATTSAVVTRVIDGDTVEVTIGSDVKKLRLIGVDTPETVDPRRSVECFGKEASAKTKELLLNKEVILEKDVSETDRYGRLLRYVYLEGAMVNEILVAEGYAESSAYPPDVKYQEKLNAAEKQAREQQKGLWSPTTCVITPTQTPST